MKARLFTAFVLAVGLALLVPGGGWPLAAQSQPAAPAPIPDRARVSAALRSAPLMFIENVGQFPAPVSGTGDQRARFQVRGDNATLYLAEDGLWVTVAKAVNPSTAPSTGSGQALRRGSGQGSGHRLKLSFVGANPHPRLEPFNRLDTHVSYFVGRDPANWLADVPVWGGVRYVDLYPGVDLEVTGDGGRWAWQLVCRSNCQFDLQKVALRVEGVDALALDGDVLRLTTALGEYTLPLLQVVGAADANLASPTITGDQVALPFASAIPNPQLAIANPQSGASDLLYSTFLGGSDFEWGFAIAVDGAGSAYVTGFTESSDFPTTAGAFDTGYTGYGDAFVVKVNADGSGLAYATFLGGSNYEWGFAIAVDGAGSAYVTGYTRSSDFPTTAGAFDTSHNGNHNAFVVKMNAAGTGLTYATFLGGSNGDEGHAIAVDGAGSAYVTGWTESSDFPITAGAFDTNYNGADDAFVVKVNADGTGLAYATFLGGSGWEWSHAIAVDGAGSAYVTGHTGSSDFPITAGAFDTSHNGVYDAFVVKVNAGGTGLAYATFLGGSGPDYGRAIAVDGAGSAYVTGHTPSSDFPTTAGAFDTSYNGYQDAFVVKVNATGTGLAYATFLGGSHYDYGYGIAVDGAGSAYVTGETLSSDFPTTAGAFDTSYNLSDAFVVKVNASGAGLAYATFLGGSYADEGNAVAVDGAGSAYVTGSTSSSDFPTTVGAFDTSHNGRGDAFVVKVNAGGTGLAYATFLGGSDYDWGNAIAVDGAGSAYVTGHTQSSDFPTTADAFDTSYNGWDDAFVAKIGTAEVTPTPTEVTNPDFEGGFFGPVGQSVANGWAFYIAGGEPTFDGEYTTVHGGSWAQKISGYAPFAAGLAQAVTVKPGTIYRVTVYYQLYPPGDGQAFLGVQDGTAPAQWVGGGEGGVWRLLSQTLTVTSDRLTLYLHGNNGTGLNTNVYFDDVTVVAVGSP